MQLFWKWTTDGEVVPATREEFGAMLEGPPAYRVVGNAKGPSSRVGMWVEVSTCFLGLDHSHGLASRPVLFESMVFELEHGTGRRIENATALEQQRYSNARAAVLGHRRLVENYLPVGEVYGWGPTVRSSGLIKLEDYELEGPQPDGELELERMGAAVGELARRDG